jgi:chromosome segregation ATPase
MSDVEVVELLRIANRYLPRIRLEYDRVKEEINLNKAELNSWKAATNNIARTYQQFVDRNIALKKREDELRHSINELEAKKTELQETTIDSNQHVAEFQETNADLEMEREIATLMNDLSTTTPNIANSYHQNENETFHYPSLVEPSAKTLIFDSKDLF